MIEKTLYLFSEIGVLKICEYCSDDICTDAIALFFGTIWGNICNNMV